MKMWKESRKGEEESRMTPQFLPAVVLFSKTDQKERQSWGKVMRFDM